MDLKDKKMEQKLLFVTGIGTEIGKTVCSAVLTRYLTADYWKPVQSGELDFSDSMKIRSWTRETTFCHAEAYRFESAASPHQSAKAEGITIDLNNISLPETQNHLIAEGAGGLLVPLNEKEYMIDLIEKLNIPVALVVRNYLGCINHTLLSIMALAQRKIRLEYLILNGNFPPDTEKIICKNIQSGTGIIRIPEIADLIPENIEQITNQLKNNA